MRTLKLNPLGVCNACGRIGSYDLGDTFRCQVCLDARLCELMEAAREVLAESHPDYSQPLHRLAGAVLDLDDLYLQKGGEKWQTTGK